MQVRPRRTPRPTLQPSITKSTCVRKIRQDECVPPPCYTNQRSHRRGSHRCSALLALEIANGTRPSVTLSPTPCTWSVTSDGFLSDDDLDILLDSVLTALQPREPAPSESGMSTSPLDPSTERDETPDLDEPRIANEAGTATPRPTASAVGAVVGRCTTRLTSAPAAATLPPRPGSVCLSPAPIGSERRRTEG